jgi:hypothetical protein
MRLSEHISGATNVHAKSFVEIRFSLWDKGDTCQVVYHFRSCLLHQLCNRRTISHVNRERCVGKRTDRLSQCPGKNLISLAQEMIHQVFSNKTSSSDD